jgi:hypothetical protein
MRQYAACISCHLHSGNRPEWEGCAPRFSLLEVKNVEIVVSREMVKGSLLAIDRSNDIFATMDSATDNALSAISLYLQVISNCECLKHSHTLIVGHRVALLEK